LLFFSLSSSAQSGFRFPSLNEARQGFTKSFKIPSVKDYQRFTDQYAKHLRMLDRRSERAYRKSFLKFVEVEDELLYSLCDSNEFRANLLMRSAAASFGTIERLRNKDQGPPTAQGKGADLRTVSQLCGQLIPEFQPDGAGDAIKDHDKKQHKFGSQHYAEYMQKRISLYPTTFKDGTKEQKKMVRKLQKRALLWKSYKSNDAELVSDFEDEHMGVVRSIKSTDSFKSIKAAGGPNYKGTQLDAAFDPASINPASILSDFKNKLTKGGVIPEGIADDASTFTELIGNLKQWRADSLNVDSVPKGELETLPEVDGNNGKRFWDRLYGGVDFNWMNETGYYPNGLAVSLLGGYKITDNSGLAVEFMSLLNGSQMGFGGGEGFNSTLVSNYSLGANIDHRIWKVIYGGIGAEMIVNEMNHRADKIFKQLNEASVMLGLPLILRAIIPVAGSKSTTIELRYDLNNKNNIKPSFDFRVGFLIGR
jgi:hypothetical protein